MVRIVHSLGMFTAAGGVLPSARGRIYHFHKNLSITDFKVVFHDGKVEAEEASVCDQCRHSLKPKQQEEEEKEAELTEQEWK